MKLSGMIDHLRQLIWMDRGMCILCGRYSGDDVICPVCRQEMNAMKLDGTRCPRCGMPLHEGETCRCSQPDGMTATQVWRYDSPAGALVRKLKFGHMREAAHPLADGIAKMAADLCLPDDTAVTWISMPAKRFVDRPFDHAQLLAEATASLLGKPCIRLLERSADVRHQLGLTGDERRTNLQGTFICPEVTQHTIILIDDVYTTGSTVTAAAECLLQAGAQRVVAITAVRALMD